MPVRSRPFAARTAPVQRPTGLLKPAFSIGIALPSRPTPFWDEYWGNGRDGNGANVMGRLLMGLRAEIRGEPLDPAWRVVRSARL